MFTTILLPLGNDSSSSPPVRLASMSITSSCSQRSTVVSMVASTAADRPWYSRSLKGVLDMLLARIFCMNAITDSSVAAASLPTRPSWLRGAGVPGALLLALALGLCLGLSGCGQKGPLELPSAAKPASGVAR